MNVIDRVESAKHTLTGSGIGKAVSKATSHEIIGPKRKHVDYIQNSLQATNISIPEVADMLFERCSNSSWVVVFKSLVTSHHLMANANERFIQYIASRQTPWMLQTFLDKGGVQGYDMSHAIRRYSSYLAEKAYAYRQMGYDFCRVARGKESGVLRNMDSTKVLKALPCIQALIDSLIATEITSNDLTNGVITAAFMLLFKDLIRLFACYNDGIINLLEKYFEMKKNDCKSALEIYKRFLSRMERVSEFLKTAEDAGIDKGDIPDLAKAPSSLLDALEQHLISLEKGKSSAPPSKPLTLAIFNADTSINTFSHQPTTTNTPTSTAEDDYIREQKRMLEKFEKKKQGKQQGSEQSSTVPNPLNPPAPNAKHHPTTPLSQQITFTKMTTNPSAVNGSTAAASSAKPSDDLLMLSANTTPSLPFQNQNTFNANFNNTSAFGSNDMFGNKTVDFNNAFNTSGTVGGTPNLMDDLLVPEKQNQQSFNNASNETVRMPGDLDQGLQKMAQSLDGLNINQSTMTTTTQKGHQWNPQKGTRLTGGNNYQIRGVALSTLPPMSQPGMLGMMQNPMMYNQQYRMPGIQQQQQPYYGMQQMPQMNMMQGNAGMYNNNPMNFNMMSTQQQQQQQQNSMMSNLFK